ncbi:MAG TPA: hypothetical protein DCZ12_15895 [Gammaproteobacteria bacterium]|nr:hypothetical protein [Gammaproteobacteria bacterium]
MPTIPNSSNIRRRTPKPPTGVIDYDATVGIDQLRGDVHRTAQLVGAIDQFRESEKAERNRYDTERAQTNALKLFAHGNQMARDAEYHQMEDVFSEHYSENREKVLALVSDPDARALFGEQLEQSFVTKREQIRAKAYAGEIAHHRGVLTKDLEEMRTVASAGDAPFSEVYENINNRIDAAIKMHHISAPQGEQLRITFSQDMIEARLEALHLEERAEFLEQVKPIMRPDDHKKWSELTKEDRDDEISREYSDGWVALGYDRDQMLKASQEIKDEGIRGRAMSMFNTHLQMSEKNEYETAAKFYNDWAFKISEEGSAYEGIPKDELKAMTPQQRENLKAMYNSRLSGREVKTPISVYHELTNLIVVKKNHAAAMELYQKNLPSLSNQDRRKFSDELNDLEAGANKPVFGAKERLLLWLNDVNIEGKRRMEVTRDFESLVEQHQKVNDGTMPDEKTMNAWVNEIVERQSQWIIAGWNKAKIGEKGAPKQIFGKVEKELAVKKANDDAELYLSGVDPAVITKVRKQYHAAGIKDPEPWQIAESIKRAEGQ